MEKNNFSRREFIGIGAAAAGASLAGKTILGPESASESLGSACKGIGS